ncbi:hypothetical protein [Sorangium sp. So ce1097]|uniref:hypothetical protein n=1 Tax=Sorangium sp. So ce1097 TaxID=3133330 RepID=UPI003F605257
MAELFGSADLIDRLQGMMDDLETRAEQAQAQAEQALNGLKGAPLAALQMRQLPVPGGSAQPRAVLP